MPTASDLRARLHVAAAAGSIGVILLGGVGSGCSARALVPTEADRYRDEIRTLKESNDSLRAQLTELERSLSVANARALPTVPAVPPAVPDLGSTWNATDVLKEEPRAIMLSLGWGSALERGAAGEPATLTLYVEPRDARGRFVQVSGYLDVRVEALRDPGRGESPTLAERRFVPSELRDAWRSGLFGTHYTVSMPINLAQVPDVSTVTVVAVLYDGPTALRLAATTTLDITAAER